MDTGYCLRLQTPDAPSCCIRDFECHSDVATIDHTGFALLYLAIPVRWSMEVLYVVFDSRSLCSAAFA